MRNTDTGTVCSRLYTRCLLYSYLSWQFEIHLRNCGYPDCSQCPSFNLSVQSNVYIWKTSTRQKAESQQRANKVMNETYPDEKLIFTTQIWYCLSVHVVGRMGTNFSTFFPCLLWCLYLSWLVTQSLVKLIMFIYHRGVQKEMSLLCICFVVTGDLTVNQHTTL